MAGQAIRFRLACWRAEALRAFVFGVAGSVSSARSVTFVAGWFMVAGAPRTNGHSGARRPLSSPAAYWLISSSSRRSRSTSPAQAGGSSKNISRISR